MSYETILYEKEDGFCVITLKNHHKLPCGVCPLLEISQTHLVEPAFGRPSTS